MWSGCVTTMVTCERLTSSAPTGWRASYLATCLLWAPRTLAERKTLAAHGRTTLLPHPTSETHFFPYQTFQTFGSQTFVAHHKD